MNENEDNLTYFYDLFYQRQLLLTWINLNSNIDKQSHAL